MEQRFQLQSHLRISDSTVVSIFALPAAFFIAIPFMVYLIPGYYPTGALYRLVLFACLTLVLITLFAVKINRVLRSVEFILTDDRFGYRSALKSASIRLEDVAWFGRRKTAGLGGWTELRDIHGAGLRIPTVVEKLPDMLTALRDQLEKLGKSDTFDKSVTDSLIREAWILEFSSRRTKPAMKSIFWIVIAFMMLSLVTAARIWGVPLLFVVTWTIMGAIFPLLGYLAANRALSIQVRSKLRHSSSPETIEVPTIPIYARSAFVFVCLYLVVGILFRIMVHKYMLFNGL